MLKACKPKPCLPAGSLRLGTFETVGGMRAVVVTDVIQGFVLVVGQLSEANDHTRPKSSRLLRKSTNCSVKKRQEKGEREETETCAEIKVKPQLLCTSVHLPIHYSLRSTSLLIDSEEI